jgi:hypothetical protein
VEAKQAEREAKRLQPDFLHDYLKDFHQISEYRRYEIRAKPSPNICGQDF